MIEVHAHQAVQSSQAIVNDQMDLDAMTDQELQDAFQQFSIEIEAQKRMKADLPWMEQVEWEAAICCAMYQRESIQFTLLYRGIDNLVRDQTSFSESQCSSTELTGNCEEEPGQSRALSLFARKGKQSMPLTPGDVCVEKDSPIHFSDGSMKQGSIWQLAGHPEFFYAQFELASQWHVLNQEGQLVVQAVEYSQPDIDAAISELVAAWGYRDITTLIEAYHRQQAHEPERYLVILQTPEGGPVYCRTAPRLFKELEQARTSGLRYNHCPAPTAEENMWLVVGNFEVE